MKIGIMSDSHHDLSAIDDAICLADDVDCWLHAGDSIDDAGYLADVSKKPVYAVPGNIDWFSTKPKEILVETFAQLEKLYNQKEHITGIPTGFLDLDYKTAGLHGSELILVAARPAMGKTAFALNIATNAAVRANVPVAIFSLEMSKEQLTSRILASEAMIDSNKLKTGKMEEEDWIKLSEGLQPLSESEIYIDDTPRYINNRNKSKMQKTKT